MSPFAIGTHGRPTFADAARAAIEKHVLEARSTIEKHVAGARTTGATWHVGVGHAWVQWARAEGGCFALGLRRHLDWVTGEVASSRQPVDPEFLPLLTGESEGPSASEGYRIRLGVLLHDEDRWWPAGANERDLSERLEWLVIQLRVRGEAHFARRPSAQRLEPPLTAGTIEISAPLGRGVSSPPVQRILSPPTNTLT